MQVPDKFLSHNYAVILNFSEENDAECDRERARIVPEHNMRSVSSLSYKSKRRKKKIPNPVGNMQRAIIIDSSPHGNNFFEARMFFVMLLPPRMKRR
jgi:hypothetical protein